VGEGGCFLDVDEIENIKEKEKVLSLKKMSY
jgi:hypothetical protein